MRAYEILTEYEFPEIQQKSQWKIPDMHSDSRHGDEGKYSDLEKLGSGGFATAYADKEDPQKVIKGSSRMFSPDGYTSFLDALSKNPEVQSSIYFPRFSDIQVYKNKNKLWPTKSYVVEMERLHKFDSLRDEEKDMLKKQLFHKDYASELKDYEAEYGNKTKTLFMMVAHAIYNRDYHAMKDYKMVVATQFIHAAAKEYDYQIDLNQGNFMIRRGRFIPQIVIIDPLGTPSGRDWTV